MLNPIRHKRKDRHQGRGRREDAYEYQVAVTTFFVQKAAAGKDLPRVEMQEESKSDLTEMARWRISLFVSDCGVSL